jgi:serine/threonine protein kinase
MGEVRRARDLKLDQDVAIKFMRADLAAQPEARQRFEHEAYSAAALNHPNIVRVLDAGEHEGQPYLVMECLPGRSLRDEIEDGALNQTRASWIARDVLAALEAAHAAGVVHRDVTPSNVLLTDTGRAKLADFGIAKAAESVDVTTVGFVVGTAAYMAPERLRGEVATPASDIYSLGVTLNQATGARDELDRDFVALVDRMMDPDPARRPSAAVALDSLERGVDIEPETDVVPVVEMTEAVPVQTVMAPALATPRLSPRARRLRLATVVIAVVLGLVLLIASSTDPNTRRTTVTDETTPPTVTIAVPTTFAPVPSAQVRTEVTAKPGPKPKGKGHHGKD